jgi:hypothetical protein
MERKKLASYAEPSNYCWPNEMKEYSLVWFPMSPEVGFIAALGATEKIHVPLFLSGNDLAAFKRSGAVNFSPVTLLYGILYGISDRAPTVDRSLSSCYFSKALELLAPELKMPDVETLILTAGANVRQDFGSAVSAIMLRNGLEILPESTKIRCDCVVDIWIAAEECNDPNHTEVLKTIVSMLNQIDIQSLASPFRKCLSYIATIAFIATAPEMEAAFIEKHFCRADIDWIPKEKKQIAEYRKSKQFSWKALSIQ